MRFRHLLIFIWAILTIAYILFGTNSNWPYKIEGDGKYYYQYLLSAVYDMDFDFSNNYSVARYPWMHTEIDIFRFRDNINPQTGRPINVYTCGPAILWFPIFLIALGVGNLISTIGLIDIDLNPWGRYMQYSIMYSSVIYALISFSMIHKLLFIRFRVSSISISILMICFSTNLFYYIIFEPAYSHIYDFLTFVLFFSIFLKTWNRESIRDHMLLGCAGGLHCLVRTQNVATVAIFSIPLLYGAIVQAHRIRSPSPVLVRLVFISAFALTFSPTLLLNDYLYGNPLIIPQGSGSVTPLTPHVWKVLFSPLNGLFVFSPILLFGLVGFVLLLKSEFRSKTALRWPLITLAAAFLIQLYINSIPVDWWGGRALGQRRLISVYLVFIFGLAYLIQILWHRGKSSIVSLAAAGFFLLNMVITMIIVFTWPPPRNIYGFIIDLPLRLIHWLFT